MCSDYGSAIFRDRVDAGKSLAEALRRFTDAPNTVVLALPRGGVPVAFEVATALHLPLDVFTVRKLGVPGQEELAMGAIASGGVRVMNENVLFAIRCSEALLEEIAARELSELERREFRYRGRRPPVDVTGQTVIIADDGVATGATMRTAILALRQRGAAHIVAAIPVSPIETCRILRQEADEVVCLLKADDFQAVGQYYQNFSQTSDEEVSTLLAQAAQRSSAAHN